MHESPGTELLGTGPSCPWCSLYSPRCLPRGEWAEASLDEAGAACKRVAVNGLGGPRSAVRSPRTQGRKYTEADTLGELDVLLCRHPGRGRFGCGVESGSRVSRCQADRDSRGGRPSWDITGTLPGSDTAQAWLNVPVHVLEVGSGTQSLGPLSLAGQSPQHFRKQLGGEEKLRP